MYGVSCDECDECFFEGELHAWITRDLATEAAEREGWMVADVSGDERVLCPSCAQEIEESPHAEESAQ
jgi:hypothetical protein